MLRARFPKAAKVTRNKVLPTPALPVRMEEVVEGLVARVVDQVVAEMVQFTAAPDEATSVTAPVQFLRRLLLSGTHAIPDPAKMPLHSGSSVGVSAQATHSTYNAWGVLR